MSIVLYYTGDIFVQLFPPGFFNQADPVFHCKNCLDIYLSVRICHDSTPPVLEINMSSLTALIIFMGIILAINILSRWDKTDNRSVLTLAFPYKHLFQAN